MQTVIGGNPESFLQVDPRWRLESPKRSSGEGNILVGPHFLEVGRKDDMRTPETESRYLKRGMNLLRRYERETGNRDPGGLRDWLIGLKPGILKTTWRQYKQGAIKVLQDLGKEDLADLLAREGSSGCCAGRLKLRRGLPDRDLEKLQKAAFGPGSWMALAWLVAGRATGLRPSEWKNARLEDRADGPVLIVENAKHTNGRGNGPVRHLHFRDLLLRVQADDPEASDIWSALKCHLYNVAEAKKKGRDGFEKYKEACRMALYRMSLRAGCKGVNLYTSRHQFAADAKKAGLSKQETASMMGHASDETATSHYGRRIQGRRGTPVPDPDPDEVATVRRARTRHDPGLFPSP